MGATIADRDKVIYNGSIDAWRGTVFTAWSCGCADCRVIYLDGAPELRYELDLGDDTVLRHVRRSSITRVQP